MTMKWCALNLIGANRQQQKNITTMSKKNFMFAVAMAALLNVSQSELTDAFGVFVNDLKAEKEGRV